MRSGTLPALRNPPGGSPPHGGQSPQKLTNLLKSARKNLFQLRNQFSTLYRKNKHPGRDFLSYWGWGAAENQKREIFLFCGSC
jgi:hypothetical protein